MAVERTTMLGVIRLVTITNQTNVPLAMDTNMS